MGGLQESQKLVNPAGHAVELAHENGRSEHAACWNLRSLFGQGRVYLSEVFFTLFQLEWSETFGGQKLTCMIQKNEEIQDNNESFYVAQLQGMARVEKSSINVSEIRLWLWHACQVDA